MELGILHKDSFAEHLESDFQVVDDHADTYAIRLVEVSERTSSARQEVFALLFHGPGKNIMPQGIHKLKHRQIGEIELFLVPVGQDQLGFLYEAIFNRLIA